MSKTDNDISRRAFSNMIWRFAERTGAQLVSLIVSIIIARILEPSAYGIVAIISVITTILFVFVDGGLGNALIQKKDADNVDFSTVFYANIVICFVLYSILFFCAPIIAKFYKNSEMVALVRVSGITLLLASVKNVQQAYVSKKMIFKKFFWATFGGTIGAGFVGILMALSGGGVWALVVSGLFNSVVDMIILRITVKWRPQFIFSFDRLKDLFSYGSKILIANVMQSMYSNIYDLIIGRLYTIADLAFYNKGKQIPNLLVINVDDSINSVLLPVMSEKQNDVDVVKKITQQALKINFYIMTPLLLGVAAIATPLVRLLYTEKWMFAIPYLQIMAIMQVFRPFSSVNLSAMKALGRSDLFFYLEIYKEIFGILFLLFTMKHGVMAITIGIFLNSFICIVINTRPTKSLYMYSLREQIMDVLPIFSLAVFMSVVVYMIQFMALNDWITIIIQIIVGCFIYVCGSKMLKIDSYDYVLAIFKQYLRE